MKKTREIDGYKINLYRIHPGREHAIHVWEPGAQCIGGRHRTLTTFNNRWYGRVGNDPDTDIYRHLKGGSIERTVAVRAAYQERYELAYKLIKQAFPEFTDVATFADGEATLYL